jgi:hypothetical protein
MPWTCDQPDCWLCKMWAENRKVYDRVRDAPEGATLVLPPDKVGPAARFATRIGRTDLKFKPEGKP